MSKIQAISDGLGGYIYPVTITDAIIDPETGEPIDFSALGAQEVEYTINNQHADANGNFNITAISLEAAPATHTHYISEITGLQAALNGKSNTDHTHIMVTSIGLEGSNVTATGNVQLKGVGNVVLSQVGNAISIAITPYMTAVAPAITDSNSNESLDIGLFTGTQAEWDAFKASMPNNKRYLVFIRS